MNNIINNIKVKRNISPFALVLISFLVVIALGSLLLVTPWANSDGLWKWDSYIDCLFTATSATCVTGLCTLVNGIGVDLTLFGQIVVLICIQIGGLGFITIFTFIITLFRKKLKFKDKYALTQAVGASSISQLRRFVMHIIIISAICEFIGTGLYFPAFWTISNGSFVKCLWLSVFHAVSMFNNAGFDLLGSTSFVSGVGTIASMPTWAYNYLLAITMVLIVFGGLSFVAIIDIVSKRKIRLWSAFTKIVLTMTVSLILLGFLVFLVTERWIKSDNPMSVIDCLFQSVTLRTAGAASYNQNDLTLAGKIMSCALMFIGGSPLSTAGGMKTTTIFLTVLTITSFLKGKNVNAFKRRFSPNNAVKAMTIMFLGMLVLIVGIGVMSAVEIAAKGADNVDGVNLVFECFSAFGTVGVSAYGTPNIEFASKIVLCLMMFMGRLGPMTLIQIFESRIGQEDAKHFDYVEEDILVG